METLSGGNDDAKIREKLCNVIFYFYFYLNPCNMTQPKRLKVNVYYMLYKMSAFTAVTLPNE